MYWLDKYKFYLLVIGELVIFPVLYGYNLFKWYFAKYRSNRRELTMREPVETEDIAVCIHEWGGYQPVRTKKISRISEFECGLKFQLERFSDYKGKRCLDISITLSDPGLLSYEIPNYSIIHVPNEGMDFTGYANFYNSIKDFPNRYVILTNSSVNSVKNEFIDNYIDFMEENLTVGLLGASYSTRMYQTLIKNNFNPHVQSFFLLTTIGVLKEVVLKNGGFPGIGIAHKLLLIREGEIRLSNIILDLGYELGCVLENGTVYKFDRSIRRDNGRRSWRLPWGDYRLYSKFPNRINNIIPFPKQ